jgi:hypothetical protein
LGLYSVIVFLCRCTLLPSLFRICSAATACATKSPETPPLPCRTGRDPTCLVSSCSALSRPDNFLHTPSPWSGRCPGMSPCRRPPRGYVVSFVAFHERGFFVLVGRFIRGGPFRVWPSAAAPQPEQHPTDGGIRSDVRGVF